MYIIYYILLAILILTQIIITVYNYRSLHRLGWPRMFCIAVVVATGIIGAESLLSLLLLITLP